ncbi:MAG TPA: hypothetical protein VMI54_04275 [Polyangiaceae bacterium]|nr:hypothetical protein [Polyangiaceae bacterium]
MTAEEQLESFIAKFSPPNQRLIRALRKAVRKLLPNANELVYDNYNFFVIAYCPTEKVSDSFFSIGANKHGANLFFGYNGTKLFDPEHLLQGSASRNRFLRLAAAKDLERAGIRALMASAVETSKPMHVTKGRLLIRSISPKQRPRQ